MKPRPYRCGHCSSGHHEACRGLYRGAGYGGTDVTCACHCEPVQEVREAPPLPSLLPDGGPACPTCGRAWFSADPGPAYRDLVRPEPAAGAVW